MKLLIVGGVAGGATAAARARRLNEDAEIVLFERGEFISFANCGLPYHIGGAITKRDDLLVTTPEAFTARYRIDIRTASEVMAINREEKTVIVRNLRTNQTYTESYDYLLLSPGAEPVRPRIQGADLNRIFCLRNIPDMDAIKTYVQQSKPGSAVVVGGGFIGLEMAENLVQQGVKTTIVELLDQVMTPLDKEMAAIVHDFLRKGGVTLSLGNAVTGFYEKDNQIQVTTQNGTEFMADLVILAIGVKPETDLARQAGLTIGEAGGILVDDTLQTSDPAVFAVGDAVEKKSLITHQAAMVPLAGPANKQARTAAGNIMGRRTLYPGVLGTSILKLFDKTIAATGLNEKQLRVQGQPYRKSYTFSDSHASYYPGADTMAIKLLFAPVDGKILGAQVVGGKGVDKRIDVLATSLYAGLTVFDLERLELAYAPPYSSAKDPVNVAGFVAANTLKNDVELIHWHALKDLDPEKYVLVDLRTRGERKREGYIEGALHIPVDDVRSRLNELDQSKVYILYCAIGLRGYVAYRILKQHGFRSKSLSGGYALFSYVKSL